MPIKVLTSLTTQNHVHQHNIPTRQYAPVLVINVVVRLPCVISSSLENPVRNLLRANLTTCTLTNGLSLVPWTKNSLLSYNKHSNTHRSEGIFIVLDISISISLRTPTVWSNSRCNFSAATTLKKLSDSTNIMLHVMSVT